MVNIQELEPNHYQVTVRGIYQFRLRAKEADGPLIEVAHGPIEKPVEPFKQPKIEQLRRKAQRALVADGYTLDS